MKKHILLIYHRIFFASFFKYAEQLITLKQECLVISWTTEKVDNTELGHVVPKLRSTITWQRLKGSTSTNMYKKTDSKLQTSIMFHFRRSERKCFACYQLKLKSVLNHKFFEVVWCKIYWDHRNHALATSTNFHLESKHDICHKFIEQKCWISGN